MPELHSANHSVRFAHQADQFSVSVRERFRLSIPVHRWFDVDAEALYLIWKFHQIIENIENIEDTTKYRIY